MHAEPISEELVKENIPGDDRVKTFDEWAAYARSNAIVSPIIFASVIRNVTCCNLAPHSRLSIL
jgi:hypothetical protein